MLYSVFKKLMSVILSVAFVCSVFVFGASAAPVLTDVQRAAITQEIELESDISLMFKSFFRGFINHFYDALGMDSKLLVTGLNVVQSKVTLEAEETETLNVKFTPEKAGNKNINWVSEDIAVASVNKEGLVTARAKGSTVIYAIAEDGGYHDSCTVVVNSKQTDTDEPGETPEIPDNPTPDTPPVVEPEKECITYCSDETFEYLDELSLIGCTNTITLNIQSTEGDHKIVRYACGGHVNCKDCSRDDYKSNTYTLYHDDVDDCTGHDFVIINDHNPGRTSAQLKITVYKSGAEKITLIKTYMPVGTVVDKVSMGNFIAERFGIESLPEDADWYGTPLKEATVYQVVAYE